VFGGVFDVALDERERFLELGYAEVESGEGLLDAYDSFVLGLDDRAAALEVDGEAGEDRETARDRGDALMLMLDRRADPPDGRQPARAGGRPRRGA
jgi:hypothetical protein